MLEKKHCGRKHLLYSNFNEENGNIINKLMVSFMNKYLVFGKNDV